MMRINKQLSKNFIFVSMLSIAFITIIANISITIFFSNYVKERRSKDDERVVRYIEQVYEDYNEFNEQSLMSIIHYSLSESVTVRIRDLKDTIIWNSGTSDLINDIVEKENNESSLSYRNYPMTYKDKVIGSIDVGRSKSIISTFEDKQFVSTINIVFAIAFIFSLVLAILSGSRVSKKFLKPIYQIIENTNLIKNGKYKEIEEVTTDTYELHELSRSIKELSERLNNQELLRRRLTSDMAHELRTPLTTLQSHIEAFMDKIWEPDRKRLAMVHEEIIHLTKLIKELSDLSIIESDEIILNKEEINVSELLNNVVEGFKPMLINKNISLKQKIQDFVVLSCDKDHLKRIFMNLLSNAYKYTNENGNIHITLEKDHNFVRFVIEDTGIGISKEDLKYVFERFYRSDLSRSRGTGGTGIGLTITKSLVEANHGEIQIESKEGEGTKIICVFSSIKSP